MKRETLKRLLSFVLVLALILSVMPSIVLWEAKAAYSENETVTETKSNRTTIYISTSGSEWYSGTSESRPKKDITKIPDYLAKGYNVKLKRGDIWYLPTGSFSLKNLTGTEENPLVIGAYGDTSKPKPTIAFLKQISDSKWTVVDSTKNIYKTDVSDMTARGDTDTRVHRLFAADEAYCHIGEQDYTKLEAEEYCDYGGYLYVRTGGGAPKSVEVTPFAGVGHRVMITNVSYLTMENIHTKGSSALNSLFYIDTPTDHLKFKDMDITHCYYYIMMWDAEDEQIHNKPEISGCYIDSNISVKEGWNAQKDTANGNWAVHSIEGITLRDGVDGAWIHNNHIRQMSHAFVAIESVSRDTDTTTTGVRNCIIEDNLLEGGNAQYARAFNICGGYNLSGVQMCRDNTFRRNKCYDMATASHLMGENNLVYSNVMSYHHMVYNEDGTLFDGKGPIPGAFDTIPWNNHVSIGNMLVNNTFYDVGGSITINDSVDSGVVHDNIYANNLIVNWSLDTPLYPGAFYDDTIALNYVMNNAVYSVDGRQDHFVVNNRAYTAEQVNQLVGYSGNVSGDPKFLNADPTLLGKNVRQDFTLSSESPFRYAGLPLDAEVYAQFPAWQRLLAEYTDLNGNPFLPDAPSIGAITYDADPPETVTITDIKTNIKPIGIVKGYPDYVGEKWEEALGATNVIVGTSDGGTATVAVKWDYTPLGDVTKCGTYVIKGKLVSEFYGNPDNLTLERTIVVQEKINLFVNGGFENVSGGQPTGWYMRGAGGSTNGYSTLCPLSGKYAGQARGTDATATSRACYNNIGDEAPEAVGARVAALGAGQYYFGISARKGSSNVAVSLSTRLDFKYEGYNADGSIPVGYGNTIDQLSADYQKSGGIVELPDGVNFLQLVFTFNKTDTTATWDAIGAYADEAELIPLRMEMTDEMVSVETEIPALTIIKNFDKYVPDWQAGLRLPTQVTVKGSEGKTAIATVTWDYSPLGDLSKVGKYTLTGKLSSNVYLNSSGLTVEQVIYIHDYQNLLINGNFDTVTGKYTPDGWAIRGTGVRYTASNVLGGYAAVVGRFDNPATNSAASSSQNQDAVGQAVAALGTGDYFFGVWSSATNPIADVTIQAQLYYKTLTGSSSISQKANAIILNKNYQQTGTVMTLPDDVYQVWLSIGTSKTDSTVDFGDLGIHFDNAQLLLIRQEVQECKHNWADATCTIPQTCSICGTTTGTALGHSYKAVVTAPTCVNGGYTTHTCSVCGDTYKDSQTEALGHNPGAAVKENIVDATCVAAGSYDLVTYCTVCGEKLSTETVAVEPTGEHNYVDGICSVCGDKEVTGPETAADLVFLQAPSLSFQDYIGMQVMIYSSLRNYYDEIYVEAIQKDPTEGNVTTKLTGFLYYYDMFLVFDQQILSWSMAEEVTLTLYGVKDGKTFVGQSYTESVETLALAMLGNNANGGNAKLCTVLVDMLNYGAAVQTTFAHNATLLPNTQIADYADLGTAGVPTMDAEVVTEGTGAVVVYQNSISMQSKVELQLLFLQDVSAYTAKAVVNGEEKTVVMDTETMAAYGGTVLRVAVGASQMRETFTIALYDAEGNAVTTVYIVSVEAYAKTLIGGAQNDVAVTMMRYGDAVAAYAAG